MAFDSGSIIKKLQEVHDFFVVRKQKAKEENLRNLELYLDLCDIADQGLQRIIAITMEASYDYKNLDIVDNNLVKRIFYQYRRKPYGEYFKNDYCKTLARCLVNIELYSIFRNREYEFRADDMLRAATASYCDSRGLFEDYDFEIDEVVRY